MTLFEIKNHCERIDWIHFWDDESKRWRSIGRPYIQKIPDSFCFDDWIFQVDHFSDCVLQINNLDKCLLGAFKKISDDYWQYFYGD